MIYQLLVVAVCAVIAVQGNLSDLEDKELEAVRQRLAEYEGIVKLARSAIFPEEDRECLPEGAQCSFFSGPNCCGFTFRCVLKDHQEETYPGGPKVWIPACRQWTG